MDFLTGKIRNLFFRYLAAAFGSALITSIYSIVDMAMVGQYHGPEGSAALAVVAPVWNIIYSLGLLTGIGGSVLFSIARGKAESRDTSNEYFTASVIGSVVLGVLVWILIIFFDRDLLLLFGAEGNTLAIAREYVAPIKFVVPLFLFNQMLAAYLRNDKNPALATGGVLAGGIFNIFGDYFFVFACDTGASGAGLATAIGSFITFVVMLSHFLLKKNTLRLVRPARASGVIIYCIGLVGADGIDPNVLNEWAIDPDASHVAITPDDAELEDLFADLAANISKPGATNIVIDEVVNPDFVITDIRMPTKGTATMINTTTLKWTIDELGTTANEGATLEFFVRHTAGTSGNKLVNESITYTDAENNQATFPAPTVQVDCGGVQPEPCPEPVEISMGSCRDSVLFDAGDVYLESQGRILQLDVNLKNVCPNKRVALAILLTGVDRHGNEYSRGLKTVTVPARHFPACRDVLVKCIKFVLPEDLDVSDGTPNFLCGIRSFRARFISHYIDTDFECCPR